MTPKLNPELANALHSVGEAELEVIDPATNRVYLIVDCQLHRRAMQALQLQENDWSAVQEGIADADAGNTMSLEDADQRLRAECGLPPRS